MEHIKTLNKDYNRYYIVTCPHCGSMTRYDFDEYWEMINNAMMHQCVGCGETCLPSYHCDIEDVYLPKEE